MIDMSVNPRIYPCGIEGPYGCLYMTLSLPVVNGGRGGVPAYSLPVHRLGGRQARGLHRGRELPRVRTYR